MQLIIIFQTRCSLVNGSGDIARQYNMSAVFNNPQWLVNKTHFIDNILRGLATQFIQTVDLNMDNEIWNKLFR